jgi:hypothetical protein
MCKGVTGDTLAFFIRRASARTSCPATTELFEASLSTHETVGWLSLNNATCAPGLKLHTASMTRKRNKNPAISKSEIESLPAGFSLVFKSFFTSSGHSIR